MPESHSIFSIGRVAGAEDQLTEMVVWLASVVPEVAREIVRLCLDAEVADESFGAVTQHGIAKGRLDALLSSPTVTLVVESKLRSAYGEGQLRKYIDYLADEATTPIRALLTLTKRAAPLPPEDDAYATARNIRAANRRWEDLHDALDRLAGEAGRDPLSARLIREFLDMLADEGLIPMRPLATEELGNAWSHAYSVERRFHEYYRACKDAIANALDAERHPNRWLDGSGYAYQDYVISTGESIAVGISASDAGIPMTPRVYRDAPIVWIAVEASNWMDWQSAKSRFEATPPHEWSLNPKRWRAERPLVWRYLEDVVGEGSFAEQCSRLAGACGAARIWLTVARDHTFSQAASGLDSSGRSA